MAVAVEEHVDAVGVGDHVVIGPGTAGLLVAQVAHDHYVVGALGAGVIHRGLHGAVHALAALVLEEAVDELAVFILEVARRGGGQRLRGGHAHEGDLQPVQLADHIGLEHQLAALVEVAADVVEVRPLSQGEELFHAVVEFVVAGDGDAVSHLVHQVDRDLALGHGAEGLALNVVAVVDKDDLVAGGDEIVTDLLQSGVAEALIDAAVHVAGKEDHDVCASLSPLGEGGGAEQGNAQDQDQEQRNQLFHRELLSYFCRVFSHCCYPAYHT